MGHDTDIRHKDSTAVVTLHTDSRRPALGHAYTGPPSAPCEPPSCGEDPFGHSPDGLAKVEASHGEELGDERSHGGQHRPPSMLQLGAHVKGVQTTTSESECHVLQRGKTSKSKAGQRLKRLLACRVLTLRMSISLVG
eukprot:7233068-Pyramimonas_sp.AAC.2